jgi:hypothetical protein
LGTETLATLVQRGVITMDQELENWVRYRYLMPKKTEPRPEVSPGGARQPTEQQSQTDPQKTGTEPGTPPAQQPSSPTQAAGDPGALPPAGEPAEPSWLGKLMERLPFVHAAPAVQTPPQQIHMEPHFHLPQPPATEVTIEEGAIQTPAPPDIHLSPHITVEAAPPADVHITLPSGEKRAAEAITEKLEDGRVKVTYIYKEDE